MTNRIVVLGGGVSGLSAAYFLARGLAKKNIQHEITLLEKGRLGGWMQSVNAGHGVFELGPRSIRTASFSGQHSLKLAHELGLEEDIINVNHMSVSAQNRFLYVNEQLHPVPSSAREYIRTQPPLSQSLLSMYMKGLFKSAPEGSETMYDVISGRFGEAVAKYYADAFARGVFASDIKELSLKAAFPQLWYMLKPKEGKMPRRPKLLENVIALTELNNSNLIFKSSAEKWSQWSLEGGLGGFIEALKKGCLKKKVKILDNTPVRRLTVRNDQKFTVEFQHQESETLDDVDHVISTVPAHSLRDILAKNSDEMSESRETLQDIGTKLSQIKFVDVGLVGLEYKGDPAEILPRIGFGHLVPSCEESKVLGIIYDSCTFPDHDRDEFPTTRLTCMMGGSWFKELFGDPEKFKVHDLEQAALESVSKQLGITSEPITVVSRLHRKCIPCYRVGHTDLVEEMEDALKENEIPLHLGGSSYWGPSINDCIYNSRFIAEDIIYKLGKSLK